MPGPVTAALTAPIRQVQSLVGPGWSAAGDPAAALAGVRDLLAGLADAGRSARAGLGSGWSGAGADAAAEFVDRTAAAIDDAAQRTAGLGGIAGDAAGAVARAHRRLQDVVDDFEARAAALEPRVDELGVARELLTEARDALARAIRVVEELLDELDRHGGALDRDGAAGLPSRVGGPGVDGAAPGPGGGSGSGSGLGGGSTGLGGGSGLGGLGSGSGLGGSGLGASPGFAAGSDWGGLGDLAGFARADDASAVDAASFGDGVAVRLPDGTLVTAPNAVAASAVRHALTQLGVPYRWGGTTPGVGLDCSGLTQWAYHQAGLDLPRLAQEQDVGAAVAPGAVLPGDLAVWDGHVAMIVGDGLMVEAGDPVKLSPIRTTNAGEGFQGFWRPTA
ncbi:C40 family peptidase [Mycobacterium sp. Y57]|uniref:C40 family peptidase n=1 Tax=Mycolicibacterium xanthum TaxID=2796469 RepID=UPI001C852153|nr:NlpC/P60 family protein [Mycolicibacterium xanthum]MBX7433020.1 C40 family peptidase [Mycolicibacterium xanthum]